MPKYIYKEFHFGFLHIYFTLCHDKWDITISLSNSLWN